MANSIFLSEDKNNIRRVFSSEILKNNIIINKKELLEKKEEFFETEYIFSTWGMPCLSIEEISHFPNLKAVFYAAGSVKEFADNFFQTGVRVFSAWKQNAIPVSEFTFAQIILANKGYFQAMIKMRNNERDSAYNFANLQNGNYGAIIGIIGAGSIGKLVMEKLRTLNVQTLVYDPFVSDDVLKKYNAKRSSLEDIFSDCNVISNHLPNIQQTVDILNIDLFEKMKENATFINTGRGAQVVEKDLIKILKQRPDITALLDVTNPEPPKPESELLTLKNVFLTPHIAGSMNCEVRRMGDFMIHEYENFIDNMPTSSEVTIDMLKNMA